MKSLLKIFIAAAVILGLSSCAVSKRAYFAPDQTQLNISLSELDYLGDVELSVEYDTYLGIIKVLRTVNGVPYDGKVVKTTSLAHSGFFSYRILGRAAHKIVETYPDADYVVVCNESEHKNVMFLGSERLVKAKVKVYSLKK